MTDATLTPSKTAAEMVTRLKELVGEQIFYDSPPVFAGATYCLSEAARCYDVWAFSASCVMSRAAMETAFLAFLASKWNGTRWEPVKLPLKPNGALREWKFKDWYDQVSKEVQFSTELRESID